MKFSRSTLVGALAVGLFALLFAPVLKYTVWTWYFSVRERASRREFDSAAWKSFIPQHGVSRTNYWAYLLPSRLRMVDDLVDHHELHGRTRSEIVNLLGEKDRTAYFSEWDLVYWLGPGRYGNAIGDSEWFVVRFGHDKRVSEYRVVHD